MNEDKKPLVWWKVKYRFETPLFKPDEEFSLLLKAKDEYHAASIIYEHEKHYADHFPIVFMDFIKG